MKVKMCRRQMSPGILSFMVTSMLLIVTVVLGMDDEAKQPLLEATSSADHSPRVVEVVEDGMTAEQQDMAKAMALAKTFFWRNMIASRWSCDKPSRYYASQQFGKVPMEELKKICENLEMIAKAADAYVRSLKCAEKHRQMGQEVAGEEPTTTTTIIGANDPEEIKKELKCLCVKPRFRVEQGQLQLSSAMEVIKAIYRDLFKWGNGESLKIKMTFANQKAWNVLDRWLKAFRHLKKQDEDILKILRKADHDHFLLEAKNALSGDPYFDRFESSTFSRQFLNAPPRFESALDAVSSVIAKINDLTHEEKKKNNERRNYLEEFITFVQQFQITVKILGNQNLTEKEKMENAKTANGAIIKVWDTAQELGLDWSTMCETGKELKAKYVSVGEMNDQLTVMFDDDSTVDKPTMVVFEEMLGAVFMIYKEMIHGPLVEKHPDELGQLLVKDPCEEAKLKVIRQEGGHSGAH